MPLMEAKQLPAPVRVREIPLNAFDALSSVSLGVLEELQDKPPSPPMQLPDMVGSAIASTSLLAHIDTLFKEFFSPDRELLTNESPQ